MTSLGTLKKIIPFLVLVAFLSMYYIHSQENLIQVDSYTHKSPTFIPDEVLQQDWQKVLGRYYYSGCNLFIVYSAYSIVGGYPPEDVIVIGVTRSFTKGKVNCRFYSKDQVGSQGQDPSYVTLSPRMTEPPSTYEEVPGEIETLEEHWNLRYAGAIIRCPLPPTWKPDLVSVILPKKKYPSNRIQIQYQSEPKEKPHKYKYQFSVCVHPLYNFNEVFHLIEWIEFYKLMGVDQFTLYNVSIGREASCILHDLMEGSDSSIKMNVHPYHNVPITKKNLIRGRCTKCALSAGSNDCLYRHRGRNSKYMVFVDMDEYIMPRESMAQNYSQLIDLLDSQNQSLNISHYSLRNGFYFLDRSDDPFLFLHCSKLRENIGKFEACRDSFLMSKVYRNDYTPFPQRTKYIIKPEGVKETGTHYALKLEPGYESLNVSETIAFSRHYRKFLTPASLKEHFEIDRISQEFGLLLVENVARKLEYFNDKCNLLNRYSVESTRVNLQQLNQNNK